VPALVDEVLAAVRPGIERNRNALRLELDPAAGLMRSDALKVRQCLLNLLSNAGKFTQDGAVTLQVKRQMVNGRAWVLFTVSDTGIGIAPEHVGQLFREFYQVDTSSTRRYEGTGLGLVITRRLCHMLGGEIRVVSAPGSGSTFTAELPAVHIDAGAPEVALELEVLGERDVARARMAVRELCQKLGARPLALQKIATVVSELARNMVLYASGGRLVVGSVGTDKKCVFIRAIDEGSGIPELDAILAGSQGHPQWSRARPGRGQAPRRRLSHPHGPDGYVDRGRGEPVSEVVTLDDKALLAVLGRYVSPTRAQSILVRARRESPGLGARGATVNTQLMARLAEGLRMFCGEADTRAAVAELTRLGSSRKVEAIELELRMESDIARARLAARDLCQALGVSPLVVQKLATIVSELARNIISYAGGGQLAIRQCGPTRRCVHIEARDKGPGIANLEEILGGRYKSRTGLGLGILGTKRLADLFQIESGADGTRVEVEVHY
jgi:signal transduction histidine kinase